MNKISKALFGTLTLLLVTNLSAKTTVCYKNDWTNPAIIENTPLDGGECKGEFSLNQMKNKNWKIKDIKIESSKKGLNYKYILTTQDLKIQKNDLSKKSTKTPLSFEAKFVKLENVNNNEATINIPNLKVGQSGVVSHIFENGKKSIISNAYVESSNDKYSKIKLISFLDLKQNALPTSTTKVKNGDILILNYLYSKSLLIAPSQDAFQAAREKFYKNSFLHSDLFASVLKANNEPLPKKKTIQKFAIKQNLGTIFFIIGSSAYVVDSKTFNVLDKYPLSYNFLEDKSLPFYTRVEEIEESPISSTWNSITSFSFFTDIFGEDKRSEEERLLDGELKEDTIISQDEKFNNYYKNMLGIK